MTEPLAIMKYVTVKYGDESMLGGPTHEAKGEAEMLAHTIADQMKHTNIKCYMQNVDRKQLGEELIFKLQDVPKAMI